MTWVGTQSIWRMMMKKDHEVKGDIERADMYPPTAPATVDKAWSQFCGGIGRGADAPYPGMIEAFEAHYGQSFTDKDWRNETGIWAAAWGYAVRRCNAAPTAPVQQPLTDDQIDAVTRQQWGEQLGVMMQAYRAYARAIEARIKGASL